MQCRVDLLLISFLGDGIRRLSTLQSGPEDQRHELFCERQMAREGVPIF